MTQFYSSTLDISSRRIQCFFEQSSPSLDDKRGKHTKRKVSNDAKRVKTDHINSFPRRPSHYCRSNTSRDYLESTCLFLKCIVCMLSIVQGLRYLLKKSTTIEKISIQNSTWVFMCQK